MVPDNENNDDARGFAGLSSLVSDVDTTPAPSPPPRVERQEESKTTTSVPRKPAPTSPQPHSRANQSAPAAGKSQPTSEVPAGMWVFGIAFLGLGLWYYNSSNEPSSYPAPAYPAAESYASSETDVGAGEAGGVEQVYEPAQLQEDRPPTGRDLVFSTDQIRYCLAEEVRMEAAKSAFNQYSDVHVARFNGMVDDYNSRCGSFRYRSGALESARRDVERFRAELEVEGRNRF